MDAEKLLKWSRKLDQYLLISLVIFLLVFFLLGLLASAYSSKYDIDKKPNLDSIGIEHQHIY